MIFVLIPGYSQISTFGIGAGANYTSLVLNNVPGSDSDYKTGVQLNAIFKSRLNNNLWIRLEPGYALRGTKLSYSINPNTRINLSYLILPVIFEFSPLEKFSVLLGPEGSYRLAARTKDGGGSSNVNSVYNSKIDLGVIAGVSYSVIHNLAFELKYNRGFISTIKDLVFTDEYGNSEGKASLCNQGVIFSIIYMIK